jgi:hypothetical protein
MPPRNWPAVVLGLRTRPQSNDPRKPADPGLAGHRAYSHLTEQRAERVHRPVLCLRRRRRAGLGADLVALRAVEDRVITQPPVRVGEAAQATVQRPDLVQAESATVESPPDSRGNSATSARCAAPTAPPTEAVC